MDKVRRATLRFTREATPRKQFISSLSTHINNINISSSHFPLPASRFPLKTQNSKLIILFLLFFAFGLYGQQDSLKQTESVLGQQLKLKKPKKFYDPKIASRRSAILPGLGQIYNDSWWKVPLLYGGFGVCFYYLNFNNNLRIKWETLTKDLLAKQAAGKAIDTNKLRVYRRRADVWRKNRDFLYLVTLGVYILNIAEAAIDAHLKGFDVSENLAWNLKPKIGLINNGTPYLGVGLTLPIGR